MTPQETSDPPAAHPCRAGWSRSGRPGAARRGCLTDSPRPPARPRTMPTSANDLIAPLPPGPLDIVGDVHGEADALAALLAHLGYRENGSHPAGRHLVFVGDLCDRGPDSPAVLEWVRDMVQRGRASAVLGNHELNLLLGDRKDGNDWFWNEDRAQDRRYHPWNSLPGQGPHPQREAALEFFAQLPLALERADLRVVHAAWHAPSVAVLRHIPPGVGVKRHFEALDTLAHRRLVSDGLGERHARERARWGAHFHNPEHPMPMLPAHAKVDERRQMAHPIRVLTSGIERPSEQAFFAAGRWRFTQRQPWWRDYDDPVPVVVGHYWRRLRPELARGILGERERDPFDGVAPLAWMGPRHNVFCIDFSAGARYAERRRDRAAPRFSTALAALRWPECELVADNGERCATQGFVPRAPARRSAQAPGA